MTDASGHRSAETAQQIRDGKLKANDVPEDERDYYLERKYPSFETCPRVTFHPAQPKKPVTRGADRIHRFGCVSGFP